MELPSKRQRSAVTRAAKRAAFKRKTMVRCFYCGRGLTRRSATGDHCQPLSKGGANSAKNIVMACLDCNLAKRSVPMKEYMRMNKIRRSRNAR